MPIQRPSAPAQALQDTVCGTPEVSDETCLWVVDADADLSLKARDRLEKDRALGCLRVTVLSLMDPPPAAEGLYIICQRRPTGSYQAIALGTTTDLSAREWVQNAAWRDLLAAGATHMHYFIEPSREVRIELATGLQGHFRHSGHCLSAML